MDSTITNDVVLKANIVIPQKNGGKIVIGPYGIQIFCSNDPNKKLLSIILSPNGLVMKDAQGTPLVNLSVTTNTFEVEGL